MRPETATTSFQQAQPIWPTGREREMNLFVGFRAAVGNTNGTRVVLRLAASSLYRAWVNGVFVGHGPARAALGWFRVDEWDITPHLTREQNVIAIEVAGYNVNSYYLPDQPAFLQAEVVAGKKVLAGTGSNFEARVLPERIQKVQRYSAQRTFSEVYRFSPEWDRWRLDPGPSFPAVECSVQEPKRLLPRQIPYLRFALRMPPSDVCRGKLIRNVQTAPLWRDRCLTRIGTAYKGYAEHEIETLPSLEIQTIIPATRQTLNRPHEPQQPINLDIDEYHTLDFGQNLTGFLGLHVNCSRATRLWLVFDELLTADGDVDFKRLNCVNIVAFDLQPGSYALETFEPYTLRYLQLMALEGACRVSNAYLRLLEHPNAGAARFTCSDEGLNRIFEAGRSTLAQNAVDLFMDCPSRERAGWLCDSFFTARAEFVLTGRSEVEKNFLENFALPESFPPLPAGMIPKCYPADHPGGGFHPNWPMWLVLQLEEYLQRSGDRALLDAFKPRIEALLRFFVPYENEHGLLENAPGGIFIEWSKANEFVDGVNFPFNMIYAMALDAGARLYDRSEWSQKSEQVRNAVRNLAFAGQYFIDQALRTNGKLELTRNRTEICQYLAFYAGVVDPQSHAALWLTLRDEFGPRRKETGAYPEIHPANAFMGNYLRLELLSRYGEAAQLLREMRGYFHFMAERTGTLWEHDTPKESCCHGFASHVCHSFFRDALGITRLDTVKRQLDLHFSETGLPSCAGEIPTPDGLVKLKWQREKGVIQYRLDLPPNYTIKVTSDASAPVHQNARL